MNFPNMYSEDLLVKNDIPFFFTCSSSSKKKSLIRSRKGYFFLFSPPQKESMLESATKGLSSVFG